MARILVVDDDELARSVVCEILENKGYDVVDAATSTDGVEIFQRREIDLIVTDLFMPPDGGPGVIKNVRAVDPNVGIILISGMALENRDLVFQSALDAGATRALEKPIRPDALLTAVAEILADTTPKDSD